MKKATPIPAPDTTVALKVGSKFMAINWRVTQADMDNGGIVPVERDGTAYVPAKAVVEAFGGTVTEDAAILGEKILKLNTAAKENGAVLIPVSAFAEAFGFFAKYYPNAPYAEGIIVISNEGFYTADAAAADTINPVTIHAVALLLSRVRKTREYVSIELPKAFYDLADPGPDKGISEKMMQDFANAGMNLELYPIPEEATKKDGVPVGTVKKITMKDCKTYPGVAHDIWTYIPAQYDGATPLNLIIFTDGQVFFEVNGVRTIGFDMPTVLDNMIHKGQIPPTAALFVGTGAVGDGYPVWGRLAEAMGMMDNRSTELDAADERFANFLFDEVIPSALGGITLSKDPKKRAIWGGSSGGAASLNVCWHRSGDIATALIACASVAMMRMAGLYQFALRNQPKKDIQVVLMGAENDHTGSRWGNWPTVTRMVGDALAYSEYTHIYLITKGAHNPEWAARLTPQLLQCVWMGTGFECDHVEIISRNGL